MKRLPVRTAAFLISIPLTAFVTTAFFQREDVTAQPMVSPNPTPTISQSPTENISPSPSPAAIPIATPSLLPGSVTVIVPQGTRVPVSVADKISSATAQVGDLIAISAAENVTANGYVVIARGGGGQAEVASVERAHGNGGSGNIGIKMDWISAVDGEKIRLTATPRTASEEDKGGSSSTATILSYALLGPLGLFFHNFAHGKDVVLDPSKVLSAFVESDVHVIATTKASGDGFAH